MICQSVKWTLFSTVYHSVILFFVFVFFLIFDMYTRIKIICMSIVAVTQKTIIAIMSEYNTNQLKLNIKNAIAAQNRHVLACNDTNIVLKYKIT